MKKYWNYVMVRPEAVITGIDCRRYIWWSDKEKHKMTGKRRYLCLDDYTDSGEVEENKLYTEKDVFGVAV